MITIIALALVILLVAVAGLWVAVRADGPAVLDALDRLSGGGREVAMIEKQQIGDHPSQKVAIYRHSHARGPLPVLVFVHGGSWANGDPDNYGFVARGLAPEGFLVMIAGYRLGEAGRYPSMLTDTASAIAWASRNAARLGGDPQHIVLAGHSAGAYNVAQVALEERWLSEAGVSHAAIAGVIGLSGPYDFFPFDSESTNAAFGTVGAGVDSQPVLHARAAVPPMLLVHGEADTLVRPRNTHALGEALIAAGAKVETAFYPGWNHNDPLLSLAAPWRKRRDVVARIACFARVSVPVQDEMP